MVSAGLAPCPQGQTSPDTAAPVVDGQVSRQQEEVGTLTSGELPGRMLTVMPTVMLMLMVWPPDFESDSESGLDWWCLWRRWVLVEQLKTQAWVVLVFGRLGYRTRRAFRGTLAGDRG